MKRRYSFALIVGMTIVSGCAFFRHEVNLQERSGPHGGALIFIDKRLPEFVEFVVIPGEKWKFQLYSYNKHLEPRTISGTANLEFELSDGTTKSIGLWNTKRFIWSRGVGYLENEQKLDNVDHFSMVLTLKRHKGRHRDTFEFSYPFTFK